MLPPIKKILYASDLEGKTQPALGLALNIALTHQAELIIMHSMEPLSPQAVNMIYYYVPKEASEKMHEEAVKHVEERMQEELTSFMDANKEELATLSTPPKTIVVHGVPSEIIQETAEKKGVDLIIMNSRTHSRIGQMVIGSTANKVIHHSKIPVLVVPIK
ncbi:universal stress protein [Marinomonas sp. TI.3.20]|uniref:universal stress protein n=1 Tax=Marinomonas sp. TI.3.20 TaxID=3121296 RepID=UPI00311EE870